MRPATKLEAGIWRLRETGLSYGDIAKRARVTVGAVAGILHRIRTGQIAPPVQANARPRGCRWVIGEPPNWAWCDAPVAGPGAWCQEHHAVVYRPFTPR
jgi:hypothetical protein